MVVSKKILVNDSFDSSGLQLLKENGYELFFGNYNGKELISFINENQISILLIRSATLVTKDVVDFCRSLKIIGRGGVGMDNINEEACKERGIITFNTPGGSTKAVAEMVFAHLLSMHRHISDCNRIVKDDICKIKILKREFSNGLELEGRTIGIWGTGRIGNEVARIALSFGMKVLMYHPSKKENNIEFNINENKFNVTISISPLDEFLKNSDIITLHIPHQETPVITEEIISKMKTGAMFINTSRSSNVNETALLNALRSGKISKAAIDVFSAQPNVALLLHHNVSITPHLGASTTEGQKKISMELARKLLEINQE